MSHRDDYLPEHVERAGPIFTYMSEVAWDELDAFGTLHNSRFAVHVNRACFAWTDEIVGRKPGEPFQPDQMVYVRAFTSEYLTACRTIGPMRVDMYPIRIGRTSQTAGFRCSDESGEVVYARGRQVVVKMDPVTGQGAPWGEPVRVYVARAPERWEGS